MALDGSCPPNTPKSQIALIVSMSLCLVVGQVSLPSDSQGTAWQLLCEAHIIRLNRQTYCRQGKTECR